MGTLLDRVLPADPVTTLEAYHDRGGGRGIEAARRLGPEATIEEVEAAGLRGRGGAGFPTGRKWATVAGRGLDADPPTVVVNGAEGEPATFKDRAILRSNPFAVLEGALVAALAVGADRVIVALKETFASERELVQAALAEARTAGWLDGVDVEITEGPGAYLFGEETALLEVLDGRPPFPRIAPPFRHGVDEVTEIAGEPGAPGDTVMANADDTGAPPTLVNNVETMAHVAWILAEGATAFRSCGTDESPGTVVVTITGETARHDVGEVPMGTSLREAIDLVGGGPRRGRKLVGAMSGVANPVIPADQLDVALTYEAMDALGSGLGAAGFIVFDDETDMVAVAAGVSRFLAVESCGQCTPCKEDGAAIADHLGRISRSEGDEHDLLAATERVATVSNEARCFLAHQHERVVGSILQLHREAFDDHVARRRPPVAPAPVGPIEEINNGRAQVDPRQADKQLDWSYDEPPSGKTPVERLG